MTRSESFAFLIGAVILAVCAVIYMGTKNKPEPVKAPSPAPVQSEPCRQ